MIIATELQRTEEWERVRQGVPTASQFRRIMSGTNLSVSAQQDAYAMELAAARNGVKIGLFKGNEHTERGHRMEPAACSFYEFMEGVDVQKVGFVWRDEKKNVGCSPDGLLGSSGGIEIKCPTEKTHLKYVKENKLPSEYIPQVFGSMWITGREFWDFISYSEESEPMIVRTTFEDEHYKRWLEKWQTVFADFELLVEQKEEEFHKNKREIEEYF